MLVLVGLAGWAVACGDGVIEPPPDPPRATAVTVTPATVTVAALDDTARFTAEVRDQIGRVMAGATGLLVEFGHDRSGGGRIRAGDGG